MFCNCRSLLSLRFSVNSDEDMGGATIKKGKALCSISWSFSERE